MFLGSRHRDGNVLIESRTEGRRCNGRFSPHSPVRKIAWVLLSRTCGHGCCCVDCGHECRWMPAYEWGKAAFKVIFPRMAEKIQPRRRGPDQASKTAEGGALARA